MTYTFPAAARRYVRKDGELPLVLTSGALPNDLSGFVYVVAPTGRSVEEGDRTGVVPFLNGDGTVYRIDLAQRTLKWALTKPPCYWAEVGAEGDPRFHGSRAVDFGITRLFRDLDLGGRNLLNTAFQAVRFGADHDRVIVSYESGRPFEVDPVSLEVLTPIGRRDQWSPTLMGGTPFELVATTSHPSFDPGHDARGQAGPGTLFMINFVRDSNLYVERFLRFFGLDDEFHALRESMAVLGLHPEIDAVMGSAAQLLGPLELVDVWPQVVEGVLQAWHRFKERTVFVEPSAKLLFWNGSQHPGSVTLEDEDGQPLSLKESAHQMGITANYVVAIDAAFKFEMDLVLPDLDFLSKDHLALVRRRLSRTQPQKTTVVLIPRAGLVDGATVRVLRVEVPCSCVHFFVDYDDAGGTKVVFYAIDNAGTDSSEFLLDSDRPAFGGGVNLPLEVLGMIPSGVDLDRIARLEIDLSGPSPTVHRTAEAVDDTMWTVALATGPTQFTSEAPGAVGDLYFFTHGFIPSAVSQLVWDLFRSPYYPTERRKVSRTRVAQLANAGGVAARLSRYDAAHPNALADSYEVPAGWLVLSPQCVPGGTRGYVVTTAFSDSAKEIWIFDGADLARGPIAKLAPPAGEMLPWGYTLHTTYLKEAHARPTTGEYRVSVQDDLVGLGSVHPIVPAHVLPHAYVTTGLTTRALSDDALLARLESALLALRATHPSRRTLWMDRAVEDLHRALLEELAPDRASFGRLRAALLAAPEAAARMRSAHAATVEHVVTQMWPLDRFVLPSVLAEADVCRTYTLLGERAIRAWAAGRPIEDVHAMLHHGTSTFGALVRSEPRAPTESALTRALYIHRAASRPTATPAHERRLVERLFAAALGPGW